MNTLTQRLASLAFIAWSGAAAAQTYSLTELGSLGGSQGSFTNWGSVNDSGQVTGYSYLSGDTTPTAFIYSNGAMHSVGAATPSQGYGINDAGQITGIVGTCGFYTSSGAVVDLNSIVATCGANSADSSAGISINTNGNIAGYATAKGGATVAAYFSAGKIKNLGTLGGTNSYGYGLNAGGQVTGYSETATGTNHAFLSSSAGLVDLGTLGGDDSVAYAINGSGNITGYSQIAGDTATHAFLYDGSTGTMHDLGGLGGTAGSGLAINSAGQIVGYANTATGDSRAFLYSAKKLVNLNSLINATDPLRKYVTLTSATGISKTGYIVANGVDSRAQGVNEVFLLTPTDTAPTVSADITGTQGENFWYITPTTLSWVVTGYPTPTTSGCGTVNVPNTAGSTYTCTATNSIGTKSSSVTIKVDTTPPTATITTPAKAQLFVLNEPVAAAYGCADSISGIATCAGTVPNGANIPTSTLGVQTFSVVAFDNAGNTTTTTTAYKVVNKP